MQVELEKQRAKSYHPLLNYMRNIFATKDFNILEQPSQQQSTTFNELLSVGLFFRGG